MATSPRFSFVETNNLAREDNTISIQSVIDSSEALAEEAREVLPYSFDECTYSKGYLRQAIWSCIDCNGQGVCYGCSIACHADHKLIELWTKRHFRCDCPTVSKQDEGTSTRRCTIAPPTEPLHLENEENRYTHNFEGDFCRCGRPYDPETETEAMIHCIACEDWFHESCLDLRVGEQPAGADDDDDDDDETKVLIPSDSYDGLICAACVGSSDLCRSKAGSQGWMIIEQGSEGPVVVGRNTPDTANAEEVDLKRSRSPEDQESVKRSKTDDGPSETSERPSGGQVDPGLDNSSALQVKETRKGKGDVFLAHGVRELLQKELDDESIAKLPFPLVDEAIYEPPEDVEEDETLDQVTNRVMSGLPRVQAIEALHGYETMKDKLMGMLRGHVAKGETVKKEDIDAFFAELRGGPA